jgi:proteasome lid subunit RPN8/RPN11
MTAAAFLNRPAGITDQGVEEFRRYACSQYPKEACGFFVATGFKPMENVSPDPENHFAIVAKKFLTEGPVLAVVHSHPNGPYYPTKKDLEGQISTAVPWGVAVCDRENCSQVVWWGDQLPVPPLKERPFVPNIYDCYSLIRDWYRTEKGILLYNEPRDWEWWEKGEDIYGSGFLKAGFSQFDGALKNLQPGDCFLAMVRSDNVLNHAGVYVGGGKILHHVVGHLSLESPLHIWHHKCDVWLRYTG